MNSENYNSIKDKSINLNKSQTTLYPIIAWYHLNESKVNNIANLQSVYQCVRLIIQRNGMYGRE